MVRTGLIGLGKMGISHCSILGAHPQVELAGVCDASEISLLAIEKYTPFNCFRDYKELIDQGNLDCVFIAIPTRLHAEVTLYAMEHHIHVFVEKPFCMSLEEGQEMVAKAEARKLVNQVGYHNRFLGTFEETKRLLEMNALGEVYHFLGEAYGPVVLKEKGSTWRSKKTEAGGCLYDYASHVVNLINFYFGEPARVTGTVLKKVYSQDVDDAVYSTLIFENGLTGQISVNWSDETYRKMSTQVTILGEKGKIVADAQEAKIYLRYDNPELGLKKGWNIRWLTGLTEPVGFYLRGEEYSAQVDYFIQSVKEKRLDNINSFSSALATDRVIDLLVKDALRVAEGSDRPVIDERPKAIMESKSGLFARSRAFCRKIFPTSRRRCAR